MLSSIQPKPMDALLDTESSILQRNIGNHLACCHSLTGDGVKSTHLNSSLEHACLRAYNINQLKHDAQEVRLQKCVHANAAWRSLKRALRRDTCNLQATITQKLSVQQVIMQCRTLQTIPFSGVPQGQSAHMTGLTES